MELLYAECLHVNDQISVLGQGLRTRLNRMCSIKTWHSRYGVPGIQVYSSIELYYSGAVLVLYYYYRAACKTKQYYHYTVHTRAVLCVARKCTTLTLPHPTIINNVLVALWILLYNSCRTGAVQNAPGTLSCPRRTRQVLRVCVQGGASCRESVSAALVQALFLIIVFLMGVSPQRCTVVIVVVSRKREGENTFNTFGRNSATNWLGVPVFSHAVTRCTCFWLQGDQVYPFLVIIEYLIRWGRYW